MSTLNPALKSSLQNEQTGNSKYRPTTQTKSQNQKSKSRPPTPLLGLNSQLSGVDLGLRNFQ